MQPGKSATGQKRLEDAILKTLIYADLFDYPLSASEIGRYLPLPAQQAAVEESLESSLAQGTVVSRNGYYALESREALIALRERREDIASRKWPAARRYSHWLAQLPYVRMVAISGTLAVNNVEAHDDIDVFIVTEPDRLWLCRALVVLAVRAAALLGDELCPNYFVSTRELVFPDHNIFSAREVAQMVPLYGEEVYREIRNLNGWVGEILPQADGMPRPAHHTGKNGETVLQLGPIAGRIKRATEWLLNTSLGTRLERWEMERKIHKFSAIAQNQGGSALFTADCCKGHFNHHDSRILHSFEERVIREPGLPESEERIDG